MVTFELFTVATLFMIGIFWLITIGITAVIGLLYFWAVIWYLSYKKLNVRKLPNISPIRLIKENLHIAITTFIKSLRTTFKVWRDSLNP